MFCLPNIFRKKKKAKLWKKAVRKLQEKHDLLLKQQEHLEKQIEDCLLTARRNAQTDRRAAFNALKRKKILEKNLTNLNNVIALIEQKRDAMDAMERNVAIKLCNDHSHTPKNDTNKKTNQQNKLADDIVKQTTMVNEISNTLRHNFLPEMNEEELAKELEILELELEDLKQSDPDSAPKSTKLPCILTKATTERTSIIKIQDIGSIMESEA